MWRVVALLTLVGVPTGCASNDQMVGTRQDDDGEGDYAVFREDGTYGVSHP